MTFKKNGRSYFIVARNNKPAKNPRPHVTLQSAKAEAKRLASKYSGAMFHVHLVIGSFVEDRNGRMYEAKLKRNINKEQAKLLEYEFVEQARLVNMGREREAALIAERDQLRRERDAALVACSSYDLHARTSPECKAQAYLNEGLLVVEERNQLKEALRQVDDVLVTNWISVKDGDYRKALNDLICWNIQVENDPAVSPLAAARKAELDTLKARVEELEKSLAEMTKDRDLWAGNHEEHSCPYEAGLTREKDRNARLKE